MEQTDLVSEDAAVSIISQLITVFTAAIKNAYPSVDVATMVTPSGNPKFGDYQCNNAMGIMQVSLILASKQY